MYGAYQDCAMACRTIQVRRDHTFTYRLSGDLYNDERHEGRWTWLGGNRIRAVIPPDTSDPSVVERSVAADDGFVVTVVDPQGAVFQGVAIRPLYPAAGAQVATNSEGVALVPRCPEFEVSVLGYVGRYRPRDEAATRFEVTLSIDQVSTMALDEVWEISDGELFILNDQGSYDVGDGLRKLSRSRERAIFGKAASDARFQQTAPGRS
jgi:hypothetical protein